jgi:transposase-like protein
VTKKGRTAKRRKAQKAKAKAKHRAAKKAKSCELCGEGDTHLRRFKVMVDGKVQSDWRTCRSCCAVLTVLLADRRNHKR